MVTHHNKFKIRDIGGRFIHAPHQFLIQNIMRFLSINNISGNYLEFGVARAHSLITAYYMSKKLGLKNMFFYGFDVFGKTPKQSEYDRIELSKNYNYECLVWEVENILIKNKVDLNDVCLVKGLYENSLTKKLQKKIKDCVVIYLDCNFYHSTRDALEFCYPLMRDGCIVVLEDYWLSNGNPDFGQRKAWEDFVKKYNINFTEFYCLGGYFKSFIINK